MIQASTMPQHLPAPAHVHQMNFTLPQSALDAYGPYDAYDPGKGIRKFLEGLLGCAVPFLKKGFGRRYEFNTYHNLENEYGHVLATVYTDGANKFKGKMAVTLNGLAWEAWNSHSPLTLDPIAICKFVFEKDGHFSKIDLALNDFRKTTDWVELVHCASKEQFRTRMNLKLSKTKPPYFCRQSTESVYFGSKKSLTQILAYQRPEAASHDMPEDFNGLKYPSWIRFEVKVRGRVQADHVATMILEGLSVETLTKGVLAYYLTFLEKGDTTKAKANPCRWWLQLVGTEKIRLTPPKPDKAEDGTDTFDEVNF